MKTTSRSFYKGLQKNWSFILLVVLAFAIKMLSLYPAAVEKYYATGVYPFFSKLLRALFGWLPFSVGDVFYFVLGLVLLIKALLFVMALIKRKVNRQYFLNGLKGIVKFILFVYVIFYSFWGLNYSRQGIAHQLNLPNQNYTVQDLDTLLVTLQKRVNEYGLLVDSVKRDSSLNTTLLFKKAVNAYTVAENNFSFLHYQQPSIKRSLYSPIGHYLGFSGYYNPFSGEAQLQTQYPSFLHPFIITHEIGHQLGYAKEDEASFAGFLACKSFNDADFKYSMYFDLYLSAVYEMMYRDTARYFALKPNNGTRFKNDYHTLQDYLLRKKNSIEPLATKFYENYLKANNQPLGKQTYNLVVYWMIGYYKKYGIESL